MRPRPRWARRRMPGTIGHRIGEYLKCPSASVVESEGTGVKRDSHSRQAMKSWRILLALPHIHKIACRRLCTLSNHDPQSPLEENPAVGCPSCSPAHAVSRTVQSKKLHRSFAYFGASRSNASCFDGLWLLEDDPQTQRLFSLFGLGRLWVLPWGFVDDMDTEPLVDG